MAQSLEMVPKWTKWGPLFQLGPAAWAAARGQPLDAHVQRLDAVPEQTLASLRGFDDA